nr:MAG TPA: hypothetical protein [Caudoviricetes sp.]DAT38558.1 MAG TPA: hypothetical protein [Caudoviricetes sp.]DAX19493.1 MAG TPA: hypothetical protein [Caudoviricetes sp.]
MVYPVITLISSFTLSYCLLYKYQYIHLLNFLCQLSPLF